MQWWLARPVSGGGEERELAGERERERERERGRERDVSHIRAKMVSEHASIHSSEL